MKCDCEMRLKAIYGFENVLMCYIWGKKVLKTLYTNSP